MQSVTVDNRVFVGLSGGVDSSVAALRLLQSGYEVTGVFIKVWQPDFLQCNWEQERLDAMRVAAKLGIPFLTCDAEVSYKQSVADYFIAEYNVGRTPNPDVMCNKYVKFGTFMEFAAAYGVSKIATGHYAQIISGTQAYELHRGTDTNKDQSYFLWTLTQDQLKHVLLPVGSSTKSEIRAEAAAAGLLTADKKDSQGICFLGQVDIPEFLSHFITLTPGAVLTETGEVVGSHRGALVYTLGQRHGFTINSHNTKRDAHYVVARNLDKNTITIASKKLATASGATVTLEQYNLLSNPQDVLGDVEVQTRYRQTPILTRVSHITDSLIRLELQETTDAVNSGQSCVLYRGTQCLGGGIIQ